MRLPHHAKGVAGVAAACALLMTACSTTTSGPSPTPSASPTTLVEPTPAPAAAQACRAVMAALPATVAGHARTTTTRLTAQWGASDVGLRCGVAKPGALAADSTCDVVNGVGWFTEQQGQGYRFTTIGRAAYLEVDVAASVQPAADALVDLSAAAAKLRDVKPCV